MLVLDLTTRFLKLFLQESTSSEAILESKTAFHAFADGHNVNIRHYHTNNIAFTTEHFHTNCSKRIQRQRRKARAIGWDKHQTMLAVWAPFLAHEGLALKVPSLDHHCTSMCIQASMSRFMFDRLTDKQRVFNPPYRSLICQTLTDSQAHREKLPKPQCT